MLLGVCFVENIGVSYPIINFSYYKIHLGILVSCFGDQKFISSRAIDQKQYTGRKRWFFFGMTGWQCYDAHSDLSSLTKMEGLLRNFKLQGYCNHKLRLRNASHIVITLGTAWTYQLKESGRGSG